jgi:hypothetical protein
MAHTACLVCLISTVIGRSKNPLEDQVLVAGTKQILSILLFLDICDTSKVSWLFIMVPRLFAKEHYAE